MATVGQNINGYTIIRELSIGNYCTSYQTQKDGVVYFLKEYYDLTKNVDDRGAFINNQDRITSKLKLMGRNVEKVVDSFEVEGRYYQIKEFIEGVSLNEWMAMHSSHIVRWSFAIQMCEIVSAIHNEGIIHQDLKPSQFMVVANSASECGFSLVLTDFDWSIVDGVAIKKVDTLYYGNIDEAVSCKTDALSLGIILSELLVGRKPHNIDNLNIFNSVEDAQVYWNNLVVSKNFTAPISIDPENISGETSDIIVRCLDPKTENRPDVEEIITVLKLDEKRLKPTATPISMLTPHLNVSIRVSAVKSAPTHVVRMDCAKGLKHVPSSIKTRSALRVNMPRVSSIYKNISFHIPSTRMLHFNIANLLNR